MNTVDSYQGQERDIILISMVRSNTSKKIGFTSDDKRMNVSLTRAKSFLVTVGNRTTLENSSKWSSYISNA